MNIFNEENLKTAINLATKCPDCGEQATIYGYCVRHYPQGKMIDDAKKAREVLGIDIMDLSQKLTK